MPSRNQTRSSRCVARLHGIRPDLAEGSPDRDKLLDAFRRADDAADSGLGQIQTGFAQITMILNSRRKK